MDIKTIEKVIQEILDKIEGDSISVEELEKLLRKELPEIVNAEFATISFLN